ncbi:hypothetical protein [Neorhizobium alkalisoli]|uniref:hypothetical protein n=1 Tax=Neorhizobium alkalisoli TaxID=528178 RepID=UPI000CF9F475|nr:hypothetical protein [Neorhizobium alkalisoli]
MADIDSGSLQSENPDAKLTETSFSLREKPVVAGGQQKRLPACAEIMTQFGGYVLWNFMVEGRKAGWHRPDRQVRQAIPDKDPIGARRACIMPLLFLFIAAFLRGTRDD